MANTNEKSAHRSGTRGVRPEAVDGEISQVQEQRPSNAGAREGVSGPGSADEPQEGRPTVGGGVTPREQSTRLARAAADGPSGQGSQPSEGVIDAPDTPRDTATPGGALGTASYEELTEDPEDESSKSDDRMETDER